MKITHEIYKDYPNQPYISPNRDLALWELHPEKFPYKQVEKNKMEYLEEKIFQGDLIMLWRINFNNFTNESVIPAYFEYRYGVDSNESIERLTTLSFIEIANATDSLDCLTVPVYKEILKKFDLEITGKKVDLINRIIQNITEEQLSSQFTVRKYLITELGKPVLANHQDIIKRHGTK